MTTTLPDAPHSGPANQPFALKLTEGLGPLPEAATKGTFPGPRGYSREQMLAYGAQERAAERERCAKLCEALERKSGNAPYTPNGFTCAAAIRRA